MSNSTWAEQAAERLIKHDEEQAADLEGRKYINEIFRVKGPSLRDDLFLTMQADIDFFNAKLSEDDPRRLTMSINGNNATVQRRNNYPVVQLVIGVHFEFFHKVEFRYRRILRPGVQPQESLAQAATYDVVVIARDSADNLYFAYDNQYKQAEEISRLLLTPLTDRVIGA